tara:strand:+ start:82 stop:1050 length:969 start_codon:yes stop_codon:yes gene_type:complete
MPISSKDIHNIQIELDEASNEQKSFLKEEYKRNFFELREIKNNMKRLDDFSTTHKYGLDIAIEYLTRIDALENNVGSKGIAAWWWRARRRVHYANLFKKQDEEVINEFEKESIKTEKVEKIVEKLKPKLELMSLKSSAFALAIAYKEGRIKNAVKIDEDKIKNPSAFSNSDTEDEMLDLYSRLANHRDYFIKKLQSVNDNIKHIENFANENNQSFGSALEDASNFLQPSIITSFVENYITAIEIWMVTIASAFDKNIKNDVKQLWKSLSECYAEDDIESNINIIKYQAERLEKFTNISCSGLLSFDEKEWNEKCNFISNIGD